MLYLVTLVEICFVAESGLISDNMMVQKIPIFMGDIILSIKFVNKDRVIRVEILDSLEWVDIILLIAYVLFYVA